MKNIFRNAVAIGIVGVMGATSAFAQNTYSGYFLDNYNYQYQMNPAFGNENGFVGFPVLGNINVAMRGNLHVRDLLYVRDGKTVLFTNPEVSTKQALKGFHDSNKLAADLKLDIINVGFKAFGGYNSIGLSARANVGVSVPGSLFSLLKEGVSNQTYSIENLRASATAYGELALNHSRDIKQVPGLRVGGTLKFIIPAGNLEANFDDARLVLGEDSWDIHASADIYARVKGLRFKHDYNDTADRTYVNGIDMESFSLNGFGMGLDLGATYDWNDFQFSLAMLDLGFISYSQTQYASTNGVKSFKTSDYTFSAFGDEDQSTFDDMIDDLTSMYQLEDMGNSGSGTRSLNATLNWGVKYIFPYYRRLNFGLVNSTRFAGPFTWTQFRVSANVRPIDIISASVNLEMGTYGVGFGWLFNLNTKKGFNLFVGMDNTLGTLAKQMIPLNSNASFNFGIDFPF